MEHHAQRPLLSGSVTDHIVLSLGMSQGLFSGTPPHPVIAGFIPAAHGSAAPWVPATRAGMTG